jgi:hypothetical protein
MIAVKVLITLSGFSWEDLIPGGGNFALKLRLYKYSVCLLILVTIWMTRGSLGRWSRFLSGLGLAFAALSLIRISFLGSGPELPRESVAGRPPMQANSGVYLPTTAPSEDSKLLSRRVIWVIFDETDFNRVYGKQATESKSLPNFMFLKDQAVFAANANSPASDTLYSIPALLTGVPIGGEGVHISGSATLSLERIDGSLLPFNESSSIFGALAARGRTAAVLGFYQPYCKLFTLQRCESFPWGRVGGLGAAFWVNIPDFLSEGRSNAAYFAEITKNLLNVLPEYLARDNALTFLHLNFPHLPAMYADTLLHMKMDPDPLVEYRHNLLLEDQVLGEIIQSLQLQAKRHDILLVVSTDHWLRKMSYHGVGHEASRPVPFIAWKVGASDGIKLVRPLSTVHTESMILDYLDGKIDSQPEIAAWWADKAFSPSFVPANR